jgi:hypothetical protein
MQALGRGTIAIVPYKERKGTPAPARGKQKTTPNQNVKCTGQKNVMNNE